MYLADMAAWVFPQHLTCQNHPGLYQFYKTLLQMSGSKALPRRNHL